MTVATAPLLEGSVFQTQIDMETDAVAAGVRRYRELAREATERGDGASLKPAERYLLHWFKVLSNATRLDQRRLRAKEKANPGANIYAPLLVSLDADQLAVITMHQALSACMAQPNGAAYTEVAYSIGRAIVAEATLPMLAEADGTNDKAKNALSELTNKCRKINPMKVNWWANKTLDEPIFNQKVCMHTGSYMLYLIMFSCSRESYDKPFAPAFKRISKNVDAKRKRGFLVMHDDVFDAIEDGHFARQTLRPRYLPMIVRPFHWLPEATDGRRTEGGYVKIRTPFTSKPTKTQKAALAKADLTQIFDCLSAVTDTKHEIFKPILKLQAQAWAEGGSIGNIPRVSDFEKPAKPADFETNEEAFKAWKKEAAATHGANQRLKADRFGFLQKMGLADRLSKFATIYFPHQLDFRGRTYPIPIHLNHHGDDICRGLLRFSTPKDASSPEAQRWLKIHAANCYGVDKVAFKDRVEWVEDHMPQIQRAVRDPLNDDWWQQADGGDQPWQFLAACFALTDPEAAAKIAIGQDGTCNGLQHYAALGRDGEGAAAVNMLRKHEDEGPDDIYTRVAKIVEVKVRADAHSLEIARLLEDYITRNLVKQPVMTSVYGVTAVGARQQLREKIKKLPIPKELRFDTSKYLAGVTLEAIGRVCVKAAEIMDWLRECAARIARDNQAVEWVTPLGLPVVQPYRQMRKVRIKTLVQTITLRVDESDLPVKTRRQCDGAPPNFVHSVDSTHKFMTARACRDRSIDFAHVHDKFLSHAATGNSLARTLREQMVVLHSQPLLANLHEQWNARYPGVTFNAPPELGSYDISAVLDAPYFFS